MERLKSCPFCGGEAKFLVKTYMANGVMREYSLGYSFGICCSKCDITTPKTDYILKFRLNDDGEIELNVDERPLAIETWNRRVNEDAN